MSEEGRHLPQRIEPDSDIKPGAYRRRFGTNRGTSGDSQLFEPTKPFLHSIERHVQMAVRSEVSDGPYSPPSFLEGYDRISPGSGENILEVASRRVDATTTIMLRESEARIAIDRRGQLMAFGVVVLVLVVATLWLDMGYSTSATILASTLIISLVVAFLASSQIETVAPFITSRKTTSGEPSGQEEAPKLEK